VWPAGPQAALVLRYAPAQRTRWRSEMA